MAGIGFELRKLLRKESYAGLLQAYAYAGIISAGPWVLSILGIFIIGLMSLSVVTPSVAVAQFQVSVTYLFVASLILTGGIQLGFTRFIADRLFENKDDMVTPNFNGVLLVVTVISGLTGIVLAHVFLSDTSAAYQLLMVAGFVTLCCIWVATIFLSGLKRYKEIVALYAFGYGITVASALVLRPLGMEGLLFGFVIGHFVLLTGMMIMTVRAYPSDRFIAFDFLRQGAMYRALLFGGLIYYLAVWIDKIIFWFTPLTSQPVIGSLRASLIYDMPIFIAYLGIIPGMAVFLVRIETDFAEYFQKFYDAVREGATLDHIEKVRDEMVYTVRQALAEIVKIQAITVLIVFVLGPWLLDLLGISDLYLPLLYIDLVSAGLQVVLLGLMTIFYYLDKRLSVVLLSVLLLLANALFTLLSIELGAPFYGYGFAVALLLTVIAAMHQLERKLSSLEYETFMLQ